MKGRQRKPCCPSCGNKRTKVLSVYHSKTTKGVRYKHLCLECEHRWTIWHGKQPHKGLHSKHPCPACGSLYSRIRTTYRFKTANGLRRRMICANCSHPWTIWQGARPDPSAYRKKPARRKITEEQVRMILNARGTSQLELAKKIGKSRSTIQRILSGGMYADVAPELPRIKLKTALTCLKCRHHQRKTCLMNVPDFLEEGITFAIDCDFFAVIPSEPMLH